MTHLSSSHLVCLTINFLNESALHFVRKDSEERYKRFSEKTQAGRISTLTNVIYHQLPSRFDILMAQEVSDMALGIASACWTEHACISAKYPVGEGSPALRDDAVAIFYRKSRFILIGQKSVPYYNTINRAFIVADLIDNMTGDVIRVVSGHITGKPDYETIHAEKFRDTLNIPLDPCLSDTSPQATESAQLKILGCDLNGDPSSPQFTMLTNPSDATVPRVRSSGGYDILTETVKGSKLDYIFEDVGSNRLYLSQNITLPPYVAKSLEDCTDHLPVMVAFYRMTSGGIPHSVYLRSEGPMDGIQYLSSRHSYLVDPPSLTPSSHPEFSSSSTSSTSFTSPTRTSSPVTSSSSPASAAIPPSSFTHMASSSSSPLLVSPPMGASAPAAPATAPSLPMRSPQIMNRDGVKFIADKLSVSQRAIYDNFDNPPGPYSAMNYILSLLCYALKEAGEGASCKDVSALFKNKIEAPQNPNQGTGKRPSSLDNPQVVEGYIRSLHIAYERVQHTTTRLYTSPAASSSSTSSALHPDRPPLITSLPAPVVSPSAPIFLTVLEDEAPEVSEAAGAAATSSALHPDRPPLITSLPAPVVSPSAPIFLTVLEDEAPEVSEAAGAAAAPVPPSSSLLVTPRQPPPMPTLPTSPIQPIIAVAAPPVEEPKSSPPNPPIASRSSGLSSPKKSRMDIVALVVSILCSGSSAALLGVGLLVPGCIGIGLAFVSLIISGYFYYKKRAVDKTSSKQSTSSRSLEI